MIDEYTIDNIVLYSALLAIAPPCQYACHAIYLYFVRGEDVKEMKSVRFLKSNPTWTKDNTCHGRGNIWREGLYLLDKIWGRRSMISMERSNLGRKAFREKNFPLFLYEQ